jgi:hypothetical protein
MKLMKRKSKLANPYVVTFHDSADGGPAHVLWLMKDYAFTFYKKGVLVAEGAILDVVTDRTGEFVVVGEWDAEAGDYTGKRTSLDIYNDFDEVKYQ